MKISELIKIITLYERNVDNQDCNRTEVSTNMKKNMVGINRNVKVQRELELYYRKIDHEYSCLW